MIGVIDINLPENQEWRERFERYRHDVIMAGGDEKVANYSAQRFDVSQQLATFIMVHLEEDRIAAIAAVFRPVTWPMEAARMGNRTWIDPDYRARDLSGRDKIGLTIRNGMKWGVTFAYNQQLDVCRRNGVRAVAMTRENRPGSRNTMHASYLGLLKARPHDGWTYCDNTYYLTCRAEDHYSCWQKAVWLGIDGADLGPILPQIKQITQDEFNQRFHNN